MFLVEKGMAGFKLGQKIEDKLGMRASMTAELVFDECKVRGSSSVGGCLVGLGDGGYSKESAAQASNMSA